MTMEDRSGGMDRRPASATTTASAERATVCNVTTDASYPLQRSAVKRSFDVAFLVAPDENLVRRQSEKQRLVTAEEVEFERVPQNLTVGRLGHQDTERRPPRSLHYISENSESPPYATARPPPTTTTTTTPPTTTTALPGLSPEREDRRYEHFRQSRRSPSPPLLTFGPTDSASPIAKGATTFDASATDAIVVHSPGKGETLRSAFTKVSFGCSVAASSIEAGQTSPGAGSSADDLQQRPSYRVSPSAVSYKYTAASFSAKMAYPFLAMSPDAVRRNALLDNLKISQIAQPPEVPSPKLAGFRAELPTAPPVYPNLPYNPIAGVFPPMADALARPRFLATAAGVAGLLPPSFAALTLPAQNVCAKCNLSFRMTSDLVYHMRSHHKNEHAGEAARRRREEKLRCPVCDESFRERHHLTRHMTAHQDKESDAIADQVEVKRRAAAAAVHGK